MQEPGLLQSSFYEDDHPVNHIKTGAISCPTKADEKELCFNSIGQQFKLGVKPILEVEKDLYNEHDFTVPVFEEQSYQLAGIESIETTKNARFEYHFLSQDSQEVPSSMLQRAENCKRKTFSIDCGILMSPPCKQTRLLESSSKDNDDTGPLRGLQEEQLYFDWNAAAKSSLLRGTASKVAEVWPAMGVKSLPRENKGKCSTLTFLALVEQAHLLSQDQVDKIKLLDDIIDDGLCPRLTLKRRNLSQLSDNLHAEKFFKRNLDVKQGHTTKDDELWVQRETLLHNSGEYRALYDQEVPTKEENRHEKQTVGEEETIKYAQRPESTETIPHQAHLQKSKVSTGKNDLTTKVSSYTVQRSLLHGDCNNGDSCTNKVCSRYALKNESTLAQRSDGNTSDSGNKKLDSFPLLQVVYNDETTITPENEHAVPQIEYKFPLLPLQTSRQRELCSSLRGIDERDLLDEIECFSDFVSSPSRTRKESLWEEMTPAMYKREEIPCLNDHQKIISDNCQLQPLEHLKCTSGEASLDSVNSTLSVEFFTQTQTFECVKNGLEDCITNEQTDDNVRRQNRKDAFKENAPFNTEADSVLGGIITNNNQVQSLENLESSSEPVSPKHPAPSFECFKKVKSFDSLEDESGDCLMHDQTAYIARQNPKVTRGEIKLNTTVDPVCDQIHGPHKNPPTQFGSQIGGSANRQVNAPDSSFENVNASNNGSLDKNDHEKENTVDSSPENAHFENRRGTISFGESVDKKSHSRSNFRTQLESEILDLDGPELLQFAMMFVEGALNKSRTNIGRVELSQSQDENKDNLRALHAFSLKNKLVYDSQHAALVHTQNRNTSTRSVTVSNEVSDANETKRDSNNDGPYPVRPLSNASGQRPLRLGLSRRRSGKPLHTYFNRGSDARTSKKN